MSTSSEDLKQAVRERLDVFNEGNLDQFEEFIAPKAMATFPGQPPLNRGDFRKLLVGFRSAFPDMKMTVENQIAEGDSVVTIWTGRGTHTGPMQDLEATGKSITLSGVSIDRFEGNKVIEHREIFDQLGMLQQLGAMPSS
jgi:steroid delta-isomerase-like uncharacterized protein